MEAELFLSIIAMLISAKIFFPHTNIFLKRTNSNVKNAIESLDIFKKKFELNNPTGDELNKLLVRIKKLEIHSIRMNVIINLVFSMTMLFISLLIFIILSLNEPKEIESYIKPTQIGIFFLFFVGIITEIGFMWFNDYEVKKKQMILEQRISDLGNGMVSKFH